MATNFFELATTLKYLGAKWLPGIKVNFMPCDPKLAEIQCKGDSALSFDLNSVSSYGTTSLLTLE